MINFLTSLHQIELLFLNLQTIVLLAILVLFFDSLSFISVLRLGKHATLCIKPLIPIATETIDPKKFDSDDHHVEFQYGRKISTLQNVDCALTFQFPVHLAPK